VEVPSGYRLGKKPMASDEKPLSHQKAAGDCFEATVRYERQDVHARI
jgi:hypothetical protein